MNQLVFQIFIRQRLDGSVIEFLCFDIPNCLNVSVYSPGFGCVFNFFQLLL